MVATIPDPKSPHESARWSYVGLIRRILTGRWEDDVRARLKLAIGDVRQDAWGPIDLSACPLRVCADQLARSYDAVPAITPPDDAGGEVLHFIARSGHWTRMPLVQRDSWALGEVCVRVDLDAYDEPTFRPVYPDRITAEPDPDHPDRPIVLRELIRRTVEGEALWTWDVFDLTDPAHPSYTVRRDESGEPGVDITELVFGRTLEGDAYPFRFQGGRPYIQLGPEWSESGYPFDLFPDLESRDGHHLSFAVGLPSSTAMPARQRGHLPVQTTVAVAFTVQLQADDLRGSYDEALDAEMTMLRALTSVKDGAGRQPLTITSIERQVVEDVHVFVGIVHATVPHPICLD